MADRILVIDDSTTLRKLVEVAMRGTGCEVGFAASGGDGLAHALARRPDVILLDYLLPDLRSAEVCARLRDEPTTADVPIVIMSANHRSVLDELRGFPAIVGFVGKPFTPAEIRARLEGVLRDPARRTRADAPAPPPAPASAQLELRGDLATTPLLDVLRLLATVQATGVLVIEALAVARISLRRGEVLLATSAGLAWDVFGDALAPDVRERVIRELAVGKPALVTLATAGLVAPGQLPLELRAASTQLVGTLLDVADGRFRWEPSLALPDFVESFGRHVSLSAIVLERGRRQARQAAGVLERVYDRAPGFSHKIASARLDREEQLVLAALDGQARGAELIERARLPEPRLAAILTRLGAADLIREARPPEGPRTLALLDLDPESFAAPLRARLARRPHPIDVVELDPTHAVAAAARAARAEIVLVGVAALTRHVLDHELPELARDGGVTVVGVLDAPNPTLAERLLHAGLHAVVAIPVHVNELERLFAV